MAWPCALTATMAVMCCRCQPRRRATFFLPFLTHTRCPTVVNCRKTPDSSSFQIWHGLMATFSKPGFK